MLWLWMRKSEDVLGAIASSHVQNDTMRKATVHEAVQHVLQHKAAACETKGAVAS